VHALQQLAATWHQGRPQGIYSVCSAHPWVIEAAIEQALEDGTELLIEATSNQVNHAGGYTGMQPERFRRLVLGIAAAKGFDGSRLILGGDHLGPNPWRGLPAREAMREAELTVQAYVRSGFIKIHLDASMPCADDRSALSDETVAQRTAALCRVAESASGSAKPLYIIGTEVPPPGGASENLKDLRPTTRMAAATTLDVHRRVFRSAGLEDAWRRVIAMVVQPGIEFSHLEVVDYDPAAAAPLVEMLRSERGLVYEAHSTDYQRAEAYRALVRDGFAILKVGPALTFAMREAMAALAQIEAEIIDEDRSSRLMEVVDCAMRQGPQYWQKHYTGDEHTQRLLRQYSYSDRMRYYWMLPEVDRAVKTLMDNLSRGGIPETMLSGYLPQEYQSVRAGGLRNDGHAIVMHRIRGVLKLYSQACARDRVEGTAQTRITSMPAAVSASKSSPASWLSVITE
jgi:D-tagatose-1,6-bisphosphate aldolase subunit GatZ/KbaZ